MGVKNPVFGGLGVKNPVFGGLGVKKGQKPQKTPFLGFLGGFDPKTPVFGLKQGGSRGFRGYPKKVPYKPEQKKVKNGQKTRFLPFLTLFCPKKGQKWSKNGQKWSFLTIFDHFLTIFDLFVYMCLMYTRLPQMSSATFWSSRTQKLLLLSLTPNS